MRIGRLVAALAGLGLLAAAAAPVFARERAQAELDRIVARVHNRIITQSDVRQARMLRLVRDTGSDDAVRRELENRILVLSDAARSAPSGSLTAADLVARRREWEARVGGSAQAKKLLAEAGMSEAALMRWLEDDLRIEAYLGRQFGTVPSSERGRAESDWINRLRLRAGLR